jgi:hypothetical protein
LHRSDENKIGQPYQDSESLQKFCLIFCTEASDLTVFAK